VSRLFELPTSTGYGFGASTLVAGLYLLPSTLCSVVLSASAGPIAARIGSKGALLCGSGVMAAALVIFVWADNPAAFLVTLGLMGVGIGLTLASLGNLIVQAVEPHQTGVASGMNIVMRMLGGAVGAQLGATIVESNVHGGIPALAGFHESFLVAAGLLVICMGVTSLVPGRERPPRAARPTAPILD
jgi:MFS family permease